MGAPGIRSFDNTARRVARLIARDGGTQLAVVELGGWDTHVNQGSGAGQLANRLKPLGDGLMALIRALGHTYKETVIVVMSEFGRTVRENGNGGTDHGHGNAMWVMGGSVRGGKVYGDCPGLAEDQLFEGRDLPVTTDFRDVCAAVLRAHIGLSTTQLAHVFPAYRPAFTHTAGLLTPW